MGKRSATHHFAPEMMGGATLTHPTIADDPISVKNQRGRSNFRKELLIEDHILDYPLLHLNSELMCL